MSSKKSKLFVNEVTKNHFIWYAIVICSGLMILVFLVPQLRMVLGLTVLPLNVWLVCIITSFIPLFVVQIFKGLGFRV